MAISVERRCAIGALRSALLDIEQKLGLPAKPSSIAELNEIKIRFKTNGEDFAHFSGGSVLAPSTISLPQKAIAQGSLSDYGEFCIAHELAHYYCWEATGKSHPEPGTKAGYRWFELYAEAFAAILTGSRLLAFVPKEEDGGNFEGREASCRLTIAMVNLRKRS